MRQLCVFFTLLGFLSISVPAMAEITLCKDSHVNHQPRADVNYDNDPVVSVPDPILVPVSIDMVERYNLNVPQGTEIETFLGMMEIYKDGRILYNGRDISGDIKDVCEHGTSEFETE